jgi:hypothetical protein
VKPGLILPHIRVSKFNNQSQSSNSEMDEFAEWDTWKQLMLLKMLLSL